MIGILAGIGKMAGALFGKDLLFESAKRVGIMVAVAAILVLLPVAGCAIKNGIIDRHETETKAKQAEATLEADRYADGKAETRRNEFDAAKGKTEKDVQDAKNNNPGVANEPVDPVNRAYYDSLPN